MKIRIQILTLFLVTSVYAQDEEYLLHSFKDHKGSIVSVSIDYEAKYLVSGSEDKCLLIYDLSTQELFREHCSNYFPPRSIEITPTHQIFYGSGSDIKLVDLENNTEKVYEGNSTHIWSLAYAPERNKIAAGSYDYKPKVWNVATTEMEIELLGHKKNVLAIAFSPDEKYLVSGSLDRSVKIWNAKTGELMRSLERHSENIYDIAFHPSGRYFASASRDKTIRLWDFETGEVIRTFVGHDQGILKVVFLPDGNHLLSASFDGSIRLWETKTGKMVYTFVGHIGPVNSIAIDGEGTLMASGGEDKKLLLWEISKKIFVEYAYYDEFYDEKEKSGLFEERAKGEKKDAYGIRMEKAEAREKEIVDALYQRYISSVREMKMKE